MLYISLNALTVLVGWQEGINSLKQPTPLTLKGCFPVQVEKENWRGHCIEVYLETAVKTESDRMYVECRSFSLYQPHARYSFHRENWAGFRGCSLLSRVHYWKKERMCLFCILCGKPQQWSVYHMLKSLLELAVGLRCSVCLLLLLKTQCCVVSFAGLLYLLW